MEVRVMAYGVYHESFAVPVVMAVVSSERAKSQCSSWIGAPLALVYFVTSQLPLPKEKASNLSLAAVVMLAVPGRMRVVALWVRVKMPENLPFLVTPADMLSKAVMVVVPVMLTLFEAAPPISVVVFEATLTSAASLSGMFCRATRVLEMRMGMG